MFLRSPQPLLIAALLLAVGPCSIAHGQEQASAARLHYRVERVYLGWIRRTHQPGLSAHQRSCFDDITSQVGALLRDIDDGRVNERLVRERVRVMARQVNEVCSLTRDEEGAVDVEVWRDPFARRMPRDRARFAMGLRFSMTPRVLRTGYGLILTPGVRASLGTFVLDWLRVSLIGEVDWILNYGPAGSLGVRAMAIAPWSLFRLGIGVAASLMVASDRVGRQEFGWFGLQLEIPVEVGFEISRNFGLNLIAAPIFTQPGEAPVSAQAIGFSAELMAEWVL